MPTTDGGLASFQGEEEQDLALRDIGIRYRYSCFKDKYAESCFSLGQWYENYKENLVKAGEMYKMTCEKYKHLESCLKYGNFLFNGLGMEPDKAGAYRIHKKNCLENKDGRSCFISGAMRCRSFASHKEDYKKGLAFYEKGCELKFPTACFHVALLNLGEFKSIEGNTEKALSSMEKACDFGHYQACIELGHFYKYGLHFEKNVEKAEEYFVKAKENLSKYPSFISGRPANNKLDEIQ